MSGIYLVLIKRDMLKYVYDVKVVRGMERSISTHSVVLCKVNGGYMDKKEK